MRMLGHVHFDRSGMTNDRTEILVRPDRISQLVRNKYVRIVNPAGNREEFLGRIVEGPFFSPEEVNRDSALAQTAILQGEEFPSIPNYYAVGGIEILGQLREGRVYGINTRPAPQAQVYELSDDEVRGLLAISGDVLVGSLDGYESVQVYLDSQSKSVFPRNVGIFGTVGSGKSNTAQVVIEEAISAGYAVIVIDVEGEYTEMDQPTTESHLAEVLKHEYQREATPISDFNVLYPVAAESERHDATAFGLRVADYDAFVLSEIIGAEEAQERRLIGVIDELEKDHNKTKGQKPQASLKAVVSPGTTKEVPYDIRSLLSAISKKADNTTGADKASYYALMGKLGKFSRARIFDVPNVDPLDARELVYKSRL